MEWFSEPLAGRVIDTGGGFVLAEWADDGSRPGEPIAPLHVHHSEDEGWYVLEGRLGFRIGDEEIVASPGSAVIAPRETPHAYWNPEAAPARYLLIMQPETWALVQALHSGSPEDVGTVFEAHHSRLLQ